MESGWRYRVFAVGGAAALAAVAVLLANHPVAQGLITTVPPASLLSRESLPPVALADQVAAAVAVVVLALWPLFKPQSRRILDTVFLTERRVFLAATALATVGYFDWSIRLARTTLVGTVALLALSLPPLYVLIRRRPSAPTRAVIVGDDRSAMVRLAETATMPVIGYVGPPSVERRSRRAAVHATDGGSGADALTGHRRLGGLSSLADVITDHDVDTVLLGFEAPDREEFFGTLATCHAHNVRAMVHRDEADGVLVAETAGGDLVDTDLDPWDFQDRLLKRVFDVAFAGSVLLAAAPLLVVVAVAIKVDSPGPVFHRQRRTAAFGETFTVAKFRSMVADAEADSGPTISSEDDGGRDPRVTRVGRVLRRTHLDEVPQLWTVLTGRMSVVGPRPERPELDADIEDAVAQWRSRWFVKPGLTGLAQINGVTGAQPEAKLRYDVAYIRKQSVWFDLAILIRQLYQVGEDALALVTGRPAKPADERGEPKG